jgi:hypothetical protein
MLRPAMRDGASQFFWQARGLPSLVVCLFFMPGSSSTPLKKITTSEGARLARRDLFCLKYFIEHPCKNLLYIQKIKDKNF